MRGWKPRRSNSTVRDPAKAKALRESALFYVRQRTQDLLTQMAVSVQGYLGAPIWSRRTIVELVKGRRPRQHHHRPARCAPAVTVAQAMTNQRAGAWQDHALNRPPATSSEFDQHLLREQTAQIHEQAASSTIPLETLAIAPSQNKSMTRWTSRQLQDPRARFDEATVPNPVGPRSTK